MEVSPENLFFFSVIFITVMTMVFMSLPKIREVVVVLCLVTTNIKILLEERY